MSTINISIIIPAYNAEKYISETIESILSQSMQSFEIIVINDGSQDRTQEIVEGYRDKNPDKIRIFYQKNQGQSAAIMHSNT